MPKEKELNLEKLEEAAFSAIDELFSEEENKDNTEILQLEEAILSLDWEFSAEQLNKLQDAILKLKKVHTDKFNKILLTMMENIAKFLATSKEYAPPDTLTILAKIARIFKEGNTLDLSQKDKKTKINEAYALFIRLKNEIADIKARKLPPKPQEEIIKPEAKEEKPVFPSEISTTQAEFPSQEGVFVKEKDFVMLKDLFQSMKNEVEQKWEESDIHFEQLDTKFADLQKQFEKIQPQLTAIEELKFEIDSLKQKITEIESKLILQEMKEEAAKETATRETEEEKVFTEKPEETEEILEMLPYVMVFSLGSEKIAVPVDNIANIYSVSPKKAANLQEKTSVLLKEFKGFWRKLKKNMKGELRALKEKELEKMEVPVLKIALNGETEKKVLKNAILIQESGKYGILFVGDLVSKRLHLPEKSEKIDKEGIKAKVEISECGEAYLINPIF
ncbi:MAG: hypothetical protein LWW94_02040 [Candidatus Desulfofervidaceae bacterium]|nr:hypothetical protein [Candidatus Desulfofervidaceae bacterium]